MGGADIVRFKTMKNPNELFQKFPEIQLKGFVLRQIKESDFATLKTVFNEKENLNYYHILPEDKADITRLFRKFIEGYKIKREIDWIIAEEKENKPVGWVTVEFETRNLINVGTITYLIDYNFRRKGIITEAVRSVLTLLREYQIGYIVAFIELDNKASVRVAEKNGFVTNQQEGFFDDNVEGGAFRYKWKVNLMDVREYLCSAANHFFQNKDYEKSIEVFQQAIEEDEIVGSPYNNLQIYSNIGMALSSLGNYEDAYNLLIQVQNYGFTNASIERELNWLRTNHPYACR